MALPNGAGGYQLGDGNLTEVILGTQPIITFNGTAGALTVPLGTDLDAAFPSMKVDSSFDFVIINTDASDAATVTANTGCTLVGVAAVAAVTSAMWRVRKTGEATYVFYRIAG